ncbi:hypothetical protein ZIOFF_067215 [Zingiber officinale]|uniref:Uncharacterized protein n=1 Tax=Zingiber officinale TaxID=94328 RepID=A0A8J5CFG1_ZINOF|nr:hypothetical protein ZIOFF_067215 [Zingiber officinale]
MQYNQTRGTPPRHWRIPCSNVAAPASSALQSCLCHHFPFKVEKEDESVLSTRSVREVTTIERGEIPPSVCGTHANGTEHGATSPRRCSPDRWGKLKRQASHVTLLSSMIRIQKHKNSCLDETLVQPPRDGRSYVDPDIRFSQRSHPILIVSNSSFASHLLFFSFTKEDYGWGILFLIQNRAQFSERLPVFAHGVEAPIFICEALELSVVANSSYPSAYLEGI